MNQKMIFNPFSYFVSLKAKLIGLAVVVALSMAAGWHVHKTIIDAENLHSTELQLEKAKEAPGKIINFHQQLRKTNVDKEACFNTKLPDATLKLLR